MKRKISKDSLLKQAESDQEKDSDDNVDIFSSLTKDDEVTFEEEAAFISKRLQEKNRKKKKSGGFQSMGTKLLYMFKLFLIKSFNLFNHFYRTKLSSI